MPERRPPKLPLPFAETVPPIVTTPMAELIIFPLNVPGTAKVAAVKLATLPVHVPVTVIVPERLIVTSPGLTLVTVTPVSTDRFAPVKLRSPGICLFVLIIQVVANVPESQRESIVKNTKAKVPCVPDTAATPDVPPATEYCRFRL